LISESESLKVAIFLMAPLARHSIKDLILLGLVQLITLPYHRFFNNNTLKPAREIQQYAANGVQQYSTDRVRLYTVLVEWRDQKQDELKFVAVAVSWPDRHLHWLPLIVLS
jgi:hypothetical protein